MNLNNITLLILGILFTLYWWTYRPPHSKNASIRLTRWLIIVGFFVTFIGYGVRLHNLNETLYYAADNGDVEEVKHLLQLGASPNAQCRDGDTALEAAQGYEHETGDTALERGDMDSYQEIVRTLKLAGAREKTDN